MTEMLDHGGITDGTETLRVRMMMKADPERGCPGHIAGQGQGRLSQDHPGVIQAGGRRTGTGAHPMRMIAGLAGSEVLLHLPRRTSPDLSQCQTSWMETASHLRPKSGQTLRRQTDPLQRK